MEQDIIMQATSQENEPLEDNDEIKTTLQVTKLPAQVQFLENHDGNYSSMPSCESIQAAFANDDGSPIPPEKQLVS